MSGAGELRSAFASTAGGVMTEEAGAVTGDLELLTRPAPDGRGVEALVRYAGSRDLYAVSGSPVRVTSEGPNEEEHQAAHGRILGLLTTPGRVEGGNELPTDLRG
jgi:hypothetical protein